MENHSLQYPYRHIGYHKTSKSQANIFDPNAENKQLTSPSNKVDTKKPIDYFSGINNMLDYMNKKDTQQGTANNNENNYVNNSVNSLSNIIEQNKNLKYKNMSLKRQLVSKDNFKQNQNAQNNNNDDEYNLETLKNDPNFKEIYQRNKDLKKQNIKLKNQLIELKSHFTPSNLSLLNILNKKRELEVALRTSIHRMKKFACLLSKTDLYQPSLNPHSHQNESNMRKMNSKNSYNINNNLNENTNNDNFNDYSEYSLNDTTNNNTNFSIYNNSKNMGENFIDFLQADNLNMSSDNENNEDNNNNNNEEKRNDINSSNKIEVSLKKCLINSNTSKDRFNIFKGEIDNNTGANNINNTSNNDKGYQDIYGNKYKVIRNSNNNINNNINNNNINNINMGSHGYNYNNFNIVHSNKNNNNNGHNIFGGSINNNNYVDKNQVSIKIKGGKNNNNPNAISLSQKHMMENNNMNCGINNKKMYKKNINCDYNSQRNRNKYFTKK